MVRKHEADRSLGRPRRVREIILKRALEKSFMWLSVIPWLRLFEKVFEG